MLHSQRPFNSPLPPSSQVSSINRVLRNLVPSKDPATSPGSPSSSSDSPSAAPLLPSAPHNNNNSSPDPSSALGTNICALEGEGTDGPTAAARGTMPAAPEQPPYDKLRLLQNTSTSPWNSRHNWWVFFLKIKSLKKKKKKKKMVSAKPFHGREKQNQEIGIGFTWLGTFLSIKNIYAYMCRKVQVYFKWLDVEIRIGSQYLLFPVRKQLLALVMACWSKLRDETQKVDDVMWVIL